MKDNSLVCKNKNQVREYAYVPERCQHPDNARKIGTFKSNVAFKKLVQNDFEIWHLKTNLLVSFHSLQKIRESFHRSIALNILNTIKMFNTTNRTSRFPTRDYNDTIGIYLRKFIRIIQIVIEILFLLFISCLLLFFQKINENFYIGPR